MISILIFANIAIPSTDTYADMHPLSSLDHCSDVDVDSLENGLRPILPEIEATPKEDNFVLVKFESTIQGTHLLHRSHLSGSWKGI